MAALNREFLLQLNLFILLAIRQQQRKRKKHRFWVKDIFQKREELGAYHRLVLELRLHDREFVLLSFIVRFVRLVNNPICIRHFELGTSSIMGRIVSLPVVIYVVEIGFVLSQRHCRFLFLSVVIGLSRFLQRRRKTCNDSYWPYGN
jgi:hypothetical protein